MNNETSNRNEFLFIVLVVGAVLCLVLTAVGGFVMYRMTIARAHQEAMLAREQAMRAEAEALHAMRASEQARREALARLKAQQAMAAETSGATTDHPPTEADSNSEAEPAESSSGE